MHSILNSCILYFPFIDDKLKLIQFFLFNWQNVRVGKSEGPPGPRKPGAGPLRPSFSARQEKWCSLRSHLRELHMSLWAAVVSHKSWSRLSWDTLSTDHPAPFVNTRWQASWAIFRPAGPCFNNVMRLKPHLKTFRLPKKVVNSDKSGQMVLMNVTHSGYVHTVVS